ncbi:hypothetical protein AGMMS50212_04330 [Spirochaetia bacterium]|nr:hypothetical protein AGMMS50212_04330 [Spirochaetia bacterium]
MEIPWGEALAKASEPRTEKPRLSTITLTADGSIRILPNEPFDPETFYYLVDLDGGSYGTLEITATPENEDDNVNYINPGDAIFEIPQTGDFFAVQVSNEQQSTTYIVAITGSGADGGGADILLSSLTVGGSSVAIDYTMQPTYASIGYPAGTFDIVASPSPYNAEVTYSGDVSDSGSTITCGTLSAGDRKTILITVTAQNGLSKTYALILYRPDAYYVKNGGMGNGETAAAPFNQLKTALDAAQASNGTVPKVVVMGELTVLNAIGLNNFLSTFKLDNYGTPGGTITISGMNNAVLRAASYSRVLYIGAGNYLNFENITLTGGTISNDNGGGIYISNSHITLSNGTRITGNKTSNGGQGGGVYIVGGTLTIAGADISNNTASNGGGGIALDGGGANVTFTQGAISGNLASGNGGGVIVNGVFTMDGGNIYGNSTSSYGGGVYISRVMTYNSGIIKTNVAPTNQGKSIFKHNAGTLNGTIGGTLTMSSYSGTPAGSYSDDDLP